MTNNVRDRFVTGGAMLGRLGAGLFGPEKDQSAVTPGTRIGAFEVREQIGSGGMGAVFRGSRVVGGFEQVVAIKLMLATDTSKRERFRAEMEILAGLNHPHIAQLIDGGETDEGLLFIAMEHVDGVPLDQYCDRHQLGTRERLKLLLKVAEALSHAHRNLVIHRDIKPSNILVDADGRPKLLDFGIAKLFGAEHRADLTQQGFMPMTPTYAAPEQFRSQTITVATDVYQFGVLIYRLLSGGLPYDATTEDPIAWAHAVLEAEPLALDKARMRDMHDGSGTRARRRSHQDLDAIVRMALAKDPMRRYGSMDALSADIEAFLDGRPVTARHGGNWYRVVRFSQRHRWAVLGSSLAILGLAATTFVAVSQARHARSEAVRLQASVDLLNSVFKAADVSNSSGGRHSLEDVLDVAAKDVMQHLEADIRAGVLLQVADAYAGMGLPARAAPLYRQAIEDLRARAVTGPAYNRALEHGALAMYWNGQFDQARQWIDEATRLVTGPDDDSATLRDGLVFTRWQMFRSEGKAQECYDVAQQGVTNAERSSAAVRETLLQRSLVRRGTSATDLGRFEEAERDLLDAVAMAKRLFGERHAASLKAQQALGWHYGSRGDGAKSLAILEPVGKQVLEVFGPHSQEWARNLYNRGNIYAESDDRWEEGVRAYRDAGQVYRESSSPSIAIGGFYAAASLLRKHNRCADALPVYTDVEQIFSQEGQLRNPIFKHVYADIAACHLVLGDLASAKAHYEQGLTQFTPAEQSSINYADLLDVGARIAEREGNATQATNLLRRAIDLVRSETAHAEESKAWQQRLEALQARPSSGVSR